MSTEQSHNELLEKILETVVSNNRQMKPGTPMAELRGAIEQSLSSLPPLEFKEFTDAASDTDAVARFVEKAPDMIGWNADQIVEWIEELAKKV